MLTDPVFLAVAALAVFIVGLSKSGLLAGMGVVGVPLLTLVIPARDAAGMMLPLLLVMDAMALYVYRKEADWRILTILLPGALIGTAIGWGLSAFVSEAAVRLIIGVIALAFVIDAVFPIRKKLKDLPPSRPWGTFWSSVSGFTSFISHTGSPPIQIYLLPMKLSPVRYAGVNAVFFAFANALKLGPYYTLGQLSVTNVTTALALIPVAITGIVVGVWLARRIDQGLFYKIAYVLIFLLAIKLLYDGITGLIAG
ncbi:sulfite exporter TauE/SafE family protein [Pelagibacterium montanilacus]|uniref:sulfite exporter TauE/SafE family protein n=1 Tax=Pelagibacterium montanilacus TaxID=2185280 RepID=UPI000F8DDD79|nr:sulfite exporter TauE/SafE family protein [Pelagibacterium montanilacus]